MTIDMLLRWFYPRTRVMLMEVKGQQARMREASHDLTRVVREKDEANRQMQESIAIDEASACQRSDVARKYIAKKNSESGLREGVVDADCSAKETPD